MNNDLLKLLQSEAERAQQEFGESRYIVPRAYVEPRWNDPESDLGRIHGLTIEFCPLSLEHEISSAVTSLAEGLEPRGQIARCIVSSFVCAEHDAGLDQILVVALEAGSPPICGSFDIVPGNDGAPALTNWRLTEDGQEANAFSRILIAPTHLPQGPRVASGLN